MSAAPQSPLRPSDDDDAAITSRGSLFIADRVVEKIVGYAVAEVDRATGAPRRMLGLNLGGADQAQVKASVDGDAASVRVAMSVEWPAAVMDVAQQVRQHVQERLRTLAGVRVADVDIEVTGLNPPPAAREGRVQ